MTDLEGSIGIEVVVLCGSDKTKHEWVTVCWENVRLSRQVENTTESTSHLQNVREVFSAVTALQIPESQPQSHHVSWISFVDDPCCNDTNERPCIACSTSCEFRAPETRIFQSVKHVFYHHRMPPTYWLNSLSGSTDNGRCAMCLIPLESMQWATTGLSPTRWSVD